MAKISLNILVSDVRNKLGNIVFSKWKKTNYVREYIKYSRGNTPKQVEVRSAFATLSSIWKTAGQLMQSSWNSFSSGSNMTGRNAFIGANMSKTLNSEALELFKSTGENPLPSLNAETAAEAGAITCTFTLPQDSTDKYLFFFSQKKDAGKGTDTIIKHDAGLNVVSPYSITGLEAGTEYFIYAVIANGEYETATEVSESVAVSATAGA